MTKKDLKNLAYRLDAIDLNELFEGCTDYDKIRKCTHKAIASSYGSYGCNGKIWQGEDGLFYFTEYRDRFVYM